MGSQNRGSCAWGWKNWGFSSFDASRVTPICESMERVVRSVQALVKSRFQYPVQSGNRYSRSRCLGLGLNRLSRSSYRFDEVKWGVRFQDMFHYSRDRVLGVDARKLDSIEPAELPGGAEVPVGLEH